MPSTFTHQREMHFIIISRHYPPEVSGGARRPYLYVKALRELGHKVTIVTPFGDSDDLDHIKVDHPVAHISHISGQVQTAGEISGQTPTQTSRQPKKSSRLRDAARQWLLWPDAEIRWNKRVRDKICALKIKADWVLTTSPPESAHCVGAQIAAAAEANWLAEFRDTWLEYPHRKILLDSKTRRFTERIIAKKALKHVDAVTSVSEAVMADVRRLAPKDTPEYIISHFSDLSHVQPHQFKGDDIHLFHAGGFSASDRHRKLLPLLNALTKCERKDLHLHLAGRLSAEEKALVEMHKGIQITSYGPIPLQQSLSMQLGADALVLVTPSSSHALPGKYAEYKLTGKPILFQGGGDWLNLIEDRSTLIAIEEGLKVIEKDITPPPKDPRRDSLQRATELVAFCYSVL